MPRQLKELSSQVRAYVLGVSAIGLAVAIHSLVQLFIQAVDFQWLILAALTLLTGNFTVRIPGVRARLSVSDTFVFASVLLFGPAAGTITALLDALIISLRLGHHAREPFRVIFNVSAVALATRVAGEVFFLSSGIQPYSVSSTPLSHILFPLFLFTLSYFLLNSWLVTLALALEQERSPLTIWRDNFLWLSVNYFGGGSVAGLLVTYTRHIDFTTLGIIVPLLLISYLTFKTSLGRIEDANQHLTQVNKMYLSTIETLAMAIDAKDQITHGHIRRVQRLAVGLAKALGVNDDAQIKAIEAAALLHDMGKLAIPEYILNKPGKLTTNEFSVMKQHANIGADILGSIQFPYPVVPIVRHHHESWDGTGYPDGLKGVTIPLGARVLSVVDCFDALTSDRPYRPRLSVQDAIGVLIERRGTMYDPLIVDRFIETQRQLSQLAEQSATEAEALETIATKLKVSHEPAAVMTASFDDRLAVKTLSLLRALKPAPKGLGAEDLSTLISAHLAKFASFESVAIYCVTDDERSLKCKYADGRLSPLVNGEEIALGERLSGWVAAHQTPIWNSDATLDLNPELARLAQVSLGSSVPLIDGNTTIGTLTLYAKEGGEITVEQRVLIQSIAPLIGAALAASLAHDKMVEIDASEHHSREAVYTVLDTVLSSRSQFGDRHNAERYMIVRVRWRVDTGATGGGDSMTRTIERAISSATNGSGYVVRLSTADVLVAAPRTLLSAAGLTPVPQQRSRATEIEVTEIANSLNLREVLGLTVSSESPQPPSSRTLIH